ncbi:recombinase family protein [Candidatus Poseidoniaceae archaeon]|nr:recombinase family protein [Candidatus Poseidoniaceae archaeon]
MRKEWNKKKFAIYLRRSKGESGSTLNQLEDLLPTIELLEKKGLLKKIDKRIVGKSIDKKYKFSSERDLKLEGDIFNEGEGASGFKVANRPVFMELLDRLKEGQYDGIIAAKMDRFARNYGAFSRYAYELFGDEQLDKDKKMFWGLQEQMGLGVPGFEGETMNAMISSLMDWGALAKKQEIIGAEKRRKGTNVDKGYLLGSKPEWPGKEYKKKVSKGVNYRAAWESHKEGLTDYQAAIAAGKRVYDARYQSWRGDTKWAKLWLTRMKAYEELGIIDNWLDSIDAVYDFINSLGAYPKVNFKSTEVTNLLKSTAGYFAYPAGVNLANTDEFIIFPYPLDIGIDRLASTKNALDLEDFEVLRELVGDRELNLYQTQPRAAKK